jgi:hypothetical protein
MRRIALIALAVLLAGSARAWVFYDRNFGDWVVVCWSSAEGAPDRQCSLSAPPQTMSESHITENLLHVQEYAPDQFQVAVEMRGDPQPDAPVWLKIGDYPPHIAPVIGRWGRWAGAEGFRIVSEMRAADRLTFRVRLAPNGRAQDKDILLIGFRDALEVYRDQIRRSAALPPSP